MRSEASGRMTRSTGTVLALVCFSALLAAAAVFNRPLFFLLNGEGGPAADWIMLSVTHLGNGLVAALIVLLLAPFRRDISLRAALALLLAGFATSLVKEVLSSPRPPAALGDLVHVVGPTLRGNSMPSGHTGTAFALAFSLRGLVPPWVLGLALGAAAGVGISRVYNGAHFPLDVAVGALAGWGASLLAVPAAAALSRRLSGRGEAAIRLGLLLAVAVGLWLALYEPMARYNPWVIRLLGFGGSAMALVLLVERSRRREDMP